jgi:hypothetical protein
MPVGADTQDLEVDTTGVSYRVLVRVTSRRQILGQPIRTQYLSRIDIHLVDKLGLDDIAVSLRMICRQPDVFVKHECSCARERQGALRHAAAEFVVNDQGT